MSTTRLLVQSNQILDEDQLDRRKGYKKRTDPDYRTEMNQVISLCIMIGKDRTTEERSPRPQTYIRYGPSTIALNPASKKPAVSL